MTSDQHFIHSVVQNGIEGAFAGYGEETTLYGTYDSLHEDLLLSTFMMKNPIQWYDLGYLKLDAFASYAFTDKVDEDRHILIRLMEKDSL